MSDIIKDLTLKEYAEIMIDAIIIAGKLVYFQPIDYASAITNALTPWRKAGITKFNMCSVFDIEINDICKDYGIPENTEGYIAIGSFTIGAIESVYAFEERLNEILMSDDFKETFTEQMNVKLSNYTSNARRLLSYTQFETIEIRIVDPLNVTNLNIGAVVETTTTITTTSDQESVGVNNQGRTASDTDSRVNTLIAIVIIFGIVIIICGIILFYKYRKDKDKHKESMVHNEIKEKIELNVYKSGVVQKNIQATEGGISDDEKSESETPVGDEIIPPENNKNKSLGIEGKGGITKIDNNDEELGDESLDEAQNVNVNEVDVFKDDAEDIIPVINQTKGNDMMAFANIDENQGHIE